MTAKAEVPRVLTPAEQQAVDRARDLRRLVPTLRASCEYVGTEDAMVALAMLLGEARQLLAEQAAVIARLLGHGGEGEPG